MPGKDDNKLNATRVRAIVREIDAAATYSGTDEHVPPGEIRRHDSAEELLDHLDQLPAEE